MVISDATRARARRDKAPVVEAPAPHEVVDVSESSRAYLDPVDQPSVRQEAYVTVDALKNFMSTMTDTTTRQVSEQVKKAVEAASLVMPLPRFEHMPIGGCEPSRRHDPPTSPCCSERIQEDPYGGGD